MKHYVYKIFDPITNEFYIGSRSCKCDIKDDKYIGSPCKWTPEDKSRLIKTIIKETFRNRETAMKYEQTIIKENIDNPLNRNYHIPGIGFHTHGAPLTNEHRKKLSENHADVSGQKNAWFGRVHSEKTRNKISDALKGREVWNTGTKVLQIPSEETRKKMSESQKKVKKTKEWCDKIRISQLDKGKVVLQYTKTGEFIKEWTSITTAIRELPIKRYMIENSLKGKQTRKSMFIWKYK